MIIGLKMRENFSLEIGCCIFRARYKTSIQQFMQIELEKMRMNLGCASSIYLEKLNDIKHYK